jgi:hypothetical protein
MNKELSKVEKYMFDLWASLLMICIFVLFGYLYGTIVQPIWGGQKTADFLTFVLVLPLLLIGHLLANLLIKKLILPMYLRNRNS